MCPTAGHIKAHIKHICVHVEYDIQKKEVCACLKIAFMFNVCLSARESVVQCVVDVHHNHIP